MNKQQYTSANTSINKNKLPRIYGLVRDRIGSGETVIDYGCGKYFDNWGLPENFVGYDPFNRPNDELLNKHYDVALCSNVLNVIKEKEARLGVLEALKNLASRIYITVYEGDRSRNSKETKDDCYQLNWSRGDYIPELVQIFGVGNVAFHHGYFVCAGSAESEVV